MQIRNFIWSILALACVACEVDGPLVTEQPAPHYQAVLRASQQAATRTSLGEGDGTAGSEQEIRWEVGDRLSVWAKKSGASAYTFEAATFQLATFNEVYSTADFMATIPAMTQGTYTYHAVYPVPESRTGTQVSYTLPATQSGQYDPALDVMAGTVTGNALASREGSEVAIPNHEPELSFSHLFHLVRIRIPEGKNLLGLPIKRLDITFPQEVVGTATFDVTNPQSVTWSNLSNKITVEIPENQMFDAGKGYVWLHVRSTVLDGQISFVAYNEVGVISGEIAATVQKTMDAQRITPIALTIPESPLAPFTYVDFREIANNLGEDWQTMTVSGYNFLVPFSPTTVSSKQFTPNSTKSYKVAICADPATLAGKAMQVRYESEHCLFDHAVTLNSTLSTTEYNRVDIAVPYLLEEDFSGAVASNSNDTYSAKSDNNTDTKGVALSGSLSGWNASRYQVFANKYTRIGVRYQKVATEATTGRYSGRLDTPPLTKLKPGANASIRVVFDMGCYIPNKAYYMDWFQTKYWDPSNSTVVTCQAGTHTNASNPIAGQNQNDVAGEFTSAYTSGAMSDETGDTGTFTENAFPHRGVSFVATGAGNTTRVCWWALTSVDPSYTICNSHYYIYLDNIKIQIAN